MSEGAADRFLPPPALKRREGPARHASHKASKDGVRSRGWLREETLSRILVVDDKEENLYLLRALLQGHGHQTTLARNGAEALARAGEEAPDLVISDILMPVMDGFSLCRRWKGTDSPLRDVPFVFYTATYTEPRDEELALSLGADRFIVKPAEPAQFLQMVTDILEEHGKGRFQLRDSCPEPEAQYLREYSEVLIHKLEDKLVQLERARAGAPRK